MNNAQTIWNQISVGTKMACGAREPVGSENELHFTVLASRKTKIVVTLDPSDTYTVKFVKIGRGYDIKVVEEMSDVYVDSLNQVIYSMCNK